MNPFTPFQPPFVYDPAEGYILDAESRVVAIIAPLPFDKPSVSFALIGTDRREISELIAQLMNEHAEGREGNG